MNEEMYEWKRNHISRYDISAVEQGFRRDYGLGDEEDHTQHPRWNDFCRHWLVGRKMSEEK